MLWGDKHRPVRVRRECVRDAAEESATDRPPPTLATDNQPGVDLWAISSIVLTTDSSACAIRAVALQLRLRAPAAPSSASCSAVAASWSSISPSFGTATTNETARANCTAAGVHTTKTTASAGLISSVAAASAVFDPSDPSWQNNTGLFTAQPPVARSRSPGSAYFAAKLEDVTIRGLAFAVEDLFRGEHLGRYSQSRTAGVVAYSTVELDAEQLRGIEQIAPVETLQPQYSLNE